jgi:hypothetical protein
MSFVHELLKQDILCQNQATVYIILVIPIRQPRELDSQEKYLFYLRKQVQVGDFEF